MNYSLLEIKKLEIVKLTFTLFLFFYASVNLSAQDYTISDKWVDCGNSCQIQDPYYSEGETIQWTGDCKDGKAHGKGKAVR